jgi:hypothetical protein
MRVFLFSFIAAIQWLLIINPVFCQNVNYGDEWRQSLTKDSKYWKPMDIKHFESYDLSPLISNTVENVRRATYTGIFGPEYKRIDFYIEAKKITPKGLHYDIVGKRRLDSIIRPLEGSMELVSVYQFQPNEFTLDPFFLGIFNYHFLDVGSKDGTGSFQGVASITFYIEDNKPNMWWSAGGDFRELNNTYVGTWESPNIKKQIKCIFSFMASGLYVRLPFCEDFYDPRDDYVGEFPKEFYTVIRDKYKPNGWSEYDPNDNYYIDKWFLDSDNRQEILNK